MTVGQSQNGKLDPLTGLPAFVATIWNRGKIQNLGTFGGGFSIAISITENGFRNGSRGERDYRYLRVSRV